jgi:DNA-directed RNA polymerase subunit RPC12/RpoP
MPNGKNTSSDQSLARCRCAACGRELLPWFDSSERIFDLDADDVAFAQWLDTACPRCGKTPRENGQE